MQFNLLDVFFHSLLAYLLIDVCKTIISLKCIYYATRTFTWELEPNTWSDFYCFITCFTDTQKKICVDIK